VDVCVHLQEPSREQWEGYHTGTRAACAGGVTTIFDMPVIGEPYVTNPASLQARFKAANERLWVDCGFLGCVQGNAPDHLADLLTSPVFGLLVWYGVQQYCGANPISLADLQQLFKLIEASGRTLPVFASCQDCSPVELPTLSPYLGRRFTGY
jgi:allantoinase